MEVRAVRARRTHVKFVPEQTSFQETTLILLHLSNKTSFKPSLFTICSSYLKCKEYLLNWSGFSISIRWRVIIERISIRNFKRYYIAPRRLRDSNNDYKIIVTRIAHMSTVWPYCNFFAKNSFTLLICVQSTFSSEFLFSTLVCKNK